MGLIGLLGLLEGLDHEDKAGSDSAGDLRPVGEGAAADANQNGLAVL